MSVGYETTSTLVRGKWLKHQLVDEHGVTVCTATVKKTSGLNKTKILDREGNLVLLLKRGLIDRDICAFGPDDALRYRLRLPKLISGALRRPFALEDNYENPVGEFILGSALPAKSLTREKLGRFSDNDLPFKDAQEIIFFSHENEKKAVTRESASLLQQIMPTVKALAQLVISAKTRLVNGPSVNGQSFRLNQPGKADPALLMFALIFQVHVIEQLEN